MLDRATHVHALETLERLKTLETPSNPKVSSCVLCQIASQHRLGCCLGGCFVREHGAILEGAHQANSSLKPKLVPQADTQSMQSTPHRIPIICWIILACSNGCSYQGVVSTGTATVWGVSQCGLCKIAVMKVRCFTEPLCNLIEAHQLGGKGSYVREYD